MAWYNKNKTAAKHHRTLADVRSSAIVRKSGEADNVPNSDEKQVVGTFITELTTAILSTVAENYLLKRDSEKFLTRAEVEQLYVTREEYESLSNTLNEIQAKLDSLFVTKVEEPHPCNLIPVVHNPDEGSNNLTVPTVNEYPVKVTSSQSETHRLKQYPSKKHSTKTRREPSDSSIKTT